MNTRSWIMVVMIVGMIGLVIPMGSAGLNETIQGIFDDFNDASIIPRTNG